MPWIRSRKWADPGRSVRQHPGDRPVARRRRRRRLHRAFQRRFDFDVVLTVTPAARNPYFNMVTLAPDGRAQLVIPPEKAVHRRQSAPAVFDITTVCYVVRPAFLKTAGGLFDGRVGAVTVPYERSIDIDTETDLRVAEALAGAPHDGTRTRSRGTSGPERAGRPGDRRRRAHRRRRRRRPGRTRLRRRRDRPGRGEMPDGGRRHRRAPRGRDAGNCRRSRRRSGGEGPAGPGRCTPSAGSTSWSIRPPSSGPRNSRAGPCPSRNKAPIPGAPPWRST